jgi:hypothetical protein
MKLERFKFFAGFFGTKTDVSAPAVVALASPTEVYTSALAQPHVLQGKMKEKKLTHGETVMATLSPVRLEGAYGKMALYFCPMRQLDITETIAEGDGGEIPGDVVVEGLMSPAGCEPGLYTLKNVRLTSNGSIQIKTTEATTWEAATI